MTNTRSILIGACIIAASVMVSNAIKPASAEMNGPFQLMHHSNTSANAGVFRIDTMSGNVSYCYIGANQALTCTRETH